MSVVERDRLSKFGETLDQLITSDISGRGVVRALYAAARDLFGEPLTVHAARALAELKAGQVVLIATGWPHRPHVAPDIAETDGPPGAAVLARTLAEVVGVYPVVVVEPTLKEAMETVMRAAGLRSVTPDRLASVASVPAPLQVASVVAMPVEEDEGRAFAHDIFERLRPAAVVVVEKGGLNAFGRAHTSRGHDTTAAIAKADFLVQQARERGVPSVAVGDGGNEVGMGIIKEAVRRHVEYGQRCQCPCGGGVAPEQPVDSLVVAAVSNWGAYGVAAAVSLLRGVDWPHDPDQEGRVLEAAAAAGFCDGPTGWVGPIVDGLPASVHKGVVALLEEAVRKARWRWR